MIWKRSTLQEPEASSYYEIAMKNRLARNWHGNIAIMVRKLLPHGYESMRHLDIGCGDGVTVRMVKPKGPITGVDLDDEMLRSARKRGIKTIRANAEDLHMLKGRTFELVTCFDALEHIEQPTLVLAEMYRVLKNRGLLILTTPNVNSLFTLVWWAWTNLWLGKYWRTCPHVHEYNLWKETPSGMSLIERLRDVGFKPDRTMLTNHGMIAGVRAIKL